MKPQAPFQIAILATVGFSLWGFIVMSEETAQAPLPMMPALSIEQMDKHLKERQDFINQLIATIEQTDSHRREHSNTISKAIQTLGVLRAQEGIDVLIKYIGFPWGRHPDGGSYPPPIRGGFGQSSLPLPDGTPAVESLIAIGEPSIPKIMANLIDIKDVFDREACIAVLRQLNERKPILDQIRKGLPQKQQESILEALVEPEADRSRRLLETVP